ncbi:MAG: hypothetical protein IPM97_16325 [Bdellovibrionaceae bacterium]|nr:hypothetical protein [Pseudobdellovibrionaceae bacterium]OYZ18364.1 MAG: hypothetical protein B7Y39_13660 [Bdellovibrio sp. 28-41-41]
MNAKQIKTQVDAKRDLNLSLITIEKAEQPSLWDRLKKAFSPSDMTLEGWERLEMKRTRPSFHSNQRRDF